MDTLVRLKLKPLGVWTTPWQADSVLGALAVAWARSHGREALQRDFVEPWLANEPPFVISDAFPGNSLPAPANIPLFDWPPEDRKKVKSLSRLSPASFRRVQMGLRPSLDDTPNIAVRDDVRMRNSISRSTDTAGVEGGELFGVEYSVLSDPDAGLTIYARAGDGGIDLLTQALQTLGVIGFGARASVGHGGFMIADGPSPCPELDDVPGADGFVSLSTFQPTPADPADGFWRSFIKYGKMSPEFHHHDVVFKRPQVMLEAGACFRTNKSPKPFYGGPIGPERLLSSEDQESLATHDVYPVQAAFALAVPMVWNNEEFGE